MGYIVKLEIWLTCLISVIGTCSEAPKCYNWTWGAILPVSACSGCKLYSQSTCDTSRSQTR